MLVGGCSLLVASASRSEIFTTSPWLVTTVLESITSNVAVPTPVGMTVPDGSGAFRPHLLPGVGVLSLSGSIDRPQRDVLALVAPT